MFFKDPANILVVCILIGFVSLVVFLKISSDKAEREEKKQKQEKDREVKKES